MKHSIHITAVQKDKPDLDRFVAALLAFAIARIEAERSERETERDEDSDE
jgi:hypothetical protein